MTEYQNPPSTNTELRAICPFCESLTQSGRVDGKFYVNLATGLYYCFHCQESGRDLPDDVIEGLTVIDEITKRNFDPTVLGKLTSNEDSDTFLEQRLSQPRSEATSALGVYYSPDYQAIAIPVKNFNGEIVGIKYRKLDPQAQPRYISEAGSVNEGYWLKGDDDKLLIVEGEIDALTALISGFKGTILATQTNRLAETAVKHVKAFKNVFVIPDKDLGGEELKNSIQSLLGPFKVISIIELPSNCKDLNDLLTKEGKDVCSQFIDTYTKTAVERDTRNLSECIPELLAFLSDERNTRGDPTGWKSIDHLLGGGLRAGEMSVINAFAKTGKSSFINNLIHNLALSGKQVGLASFEMDPARSIYPTLLSIALGTNIRELSEDDRKDLITECASDFDYLHNITAFRRFGYTPWEDVEEWCKFMKKTKDISYLVLDHAGFMVEKMTDAEENQVLAKNIKRLTNELGIHILVVVQAPKTKDGLSIQTSYGGLAWGMNADNFFILERSKSNESELRVKLEAARYPGSNPSSVPALLYYQRESCVLTE